MRLPTVSGAGQWIKCPASFKAQIEYPRIDNTPSQSALEGRACHRMLEQIRDGDVIFAGEVDPEFGVVRTAEMLEAVWDCHQATPENATLEEKIDLSHIHQGWYGYCDAWFIEDNVLHVYDYKFGRTFVEVEENPQLIAYALGISHKLSLDADTPVSLHILQPRCYVQGERSHRTWSTSVGELLQYVPMFRQAIEDALSSTPKAVTGNQCKYCSARAFCKSFKESQYDCIDFSNYLSLDNLSNDQLGVDLILINEAFERLKMAKDALEEQALFKLQNGEPVTGWEINTMNGRQKWKDGAEEAIKSIGKLFGVEVTEQKLLTPRQIEKKGVDKTVISSYIETPISTKLSRFDASNIAKLFK